jgi:ribonuclease D
MRVRTKIATPASGSSPKDKRMLIQNNMYRENITVEEIAEFELRWFSGELILVDNIEDFNRIIPLFAKEKVLGFDTETKPSFKKGRKNAVSLIQLSTGTLAALFRINRIGLPPALVKILSDPNITKAGVAVHDDIRFLKSVRGFEPAGFVDLQQFVKPFGIESSGLKKLAAIVLGIRISKRQQVTDWEAEELSEAQQIYAATDAWVCHEIYCKLNNN